MRILTALFISLAFAAPLAAQVPEQTLATVGTEKIVVADLSPEVAAAYVNLSQEVADFRKTLLDVQIADTVFGLEAAAKGQTVEKYTDIIKSKVPDPSEADILAVYNANRAAIGDRTLDQVRQQIVRLLREEPERRALLAVYNQLTAKSKVVLGKDVNSLSLRPTDVLATVGTKVITVKDFDEANRVVLYETKAKVFDKVKEELNGLIFSALVKAEAKALSVETNQIIAGEITGKLKDFTEAERLELESALKKRLVAKFKPSVLFKEPAPMIHAVTTDGAPSKGPATAPVTVVMFTDFQCSACASVHPILKRTLAEYGDKVRFFVRNYPLTQIHENAMRAAIAAAAAHQQGKFFEFTEQLYANQNALDADSLVKYARESGLNIAQFELDLQSEKLAGKVQRDIADGRSYGVSSTPSVFINGVKVRVNSAENFRESIDRALGKSSPR